MQTFQRRTMKLLGGGRILSYNTPNYPSSKGYQPGGVIGAVFGRLHQRYQKSGKDKYGRWVWFQFVGKNGTVRIYSFYRVNPTYDGQTGMTTAWSQQRRELLDHNIDVNPRKHAIQSIRDDIQKAVDDGISVILMSDLNEAITSSEGTNEIFLNMGLFNVMEHRIGEGLPATRIPGSQGIDHIWVTYDLIHHVKRAGYAPLHFFDRSDHRAIVMDIDLRYILDKDLVSLKNKVERKLRTSMPDRMEKYIKYVITQWDYHRIHDRILSIKHEISNSSDNNLYIKKLNDIDKQITEILNAGEKKCTKVPSGTNVEWSPNLHQAIEKIRECEYNLRQLQQVHITAPYERDLTFREAKQALSDAQSKYKTVKTNAKAERKKHLEQQAAYYAKDKSAKGIKSEIKRILGVEKQRLTATRINFALNRNNKVGINGILIPDITEYTEQEQREHGFNHMNIERMGAKISKNNGKDIQRWERITHRLTVEKLLLDWQGSVDISYKRLKHHLHLNSGDTN